MKTNRLEGIWNRIAIFFEDGDLTPIAVLISVAHYGPVLVAEGEHMVIAWLVGTLMDLLHFRTVRKLFDARGWPMVGYAFVAALTTAMALGYHLRFYGNDWLLAAPIPIGIAILAQHASSQRQTEGNALHDEYKAAQVTIKQLQDDNKVAQTTIKQLQDDNKGLQKTVKLWQTLNNEVQTLAMYNAKVITAEEAADKINVKDVRTVQSRAERLNGVNHV